MIEHKDRRMRLSLAFVDRPGGQWTSVDGRRGAPGIGRIALHRSLEAYWYPIGLSGPLAELEIAKRALVEDATGAVLGQRLVRQHVQAQRGNLRRQLVEIKFVAIALAHIATGED